MTLPPVVGGRMSLNLFAALVGPSGSGKGACESAARDAVVCSYDRTGQLPVVVEEFPVGSGEGIARTFRPAGLPDEEPNPRDRALFIAPEVDTLAALTERSGATLEAELRKLYSGESIGFNNAGKLTRSVVAAHSYRACLTLGVQPLRAQALLDGADGGTPQRITWLPVIDEDAPDTAPSEPEVWTVHMSDWRPGSLDIPERARRAIDDARLTRLRGRTDENALDGHALLSRLKIAAALAVLDGRTAVADDDWNLAGVVVAVSNATRRKVQAAAAEQVQRANKARALAAAERDRHVAEHKGARACDRILHWLDQGPLMRSDLRRKLKVDVRDSFDSAIAELIDRGEVFETRDGHKTVYSRTPEGHGTRGTRATSTGPEQREHGDSDGTPRGTRVPVAVVASVPVSPGRVPPLPPHNPSPDPAEVVRVPRVPVSLGQNADTADRAAVKVRQLLMRKPELTAREMRRTLSAETRPGLAAALESLAAEGVLVSREDGPKVLYRLAPSDPSPSA
ncbi:hypothetical protein ACTD5D_33225 [Nocardia takedensis]|uniref:hypothetical protein n=1 Tax=Nocardia takedensis TaxID=259390 RepID=UPI003F777594